MKTGGGLDFKQQATIKQSYSVFIEHILWLEAVRDMWDQGHLPSIAYLSLAKM